ncbi:unnamed protein product [Adineta steineri]|uniref:Uncharacterized protein n=1 Tax=Adineta steineri TaxID=433720 RepID=A0A819QNP3_9BILA|nr:unnamed protein product [Adineta steineri]CAF4034902.1 unnamed protein product [Adineta steineri]CAF4133525.1 unnamed protein product [Adineta steineri]
MGNYTSITSIQNNTQANAKHVSNFSNDAVANRRINMQRMQSVLLVWLDTNINENNADCSNTIKQLKRVVNNVNTFIDREECFEFILTINNNKTPFSIFCKNPEWHKQWAKEWSKIKGVFTDISSICEALRQAAHQCEQNTIAISFLASNKKLDQLDPSFMYTQILKEIFLTIDFEDKHIKEFITYCRDVYDNDEHELRNINQLQAIYTKTIYPYGGIHGMHFYIVCSINH